MRPGELQQHSAPAPMVATDVAAVRTDWRNRKALFPETGNPIATRKNKLKNLDMPNLSFNFAPHFSIGTLADRLGNGLQNRVEQFDSARYLLSHDGLRGTS